MEQLRSGLWTWTAPHPGWSPEEGGPDGWDEVVRSYALDTGEELVLIDPLSPPPLVDELAGDRSLSVVLTVHWHRRSSSDLGPRLGAVVHAPASEVERVEAGAMPYTAASALPGQIEAKPTVYPEEFVLWIPAHGALVFGDVVLGGERGLHVQPDSWVENATPAEVRESLRPLLALPVELLLLTHGDPVTEDAAAALELALRL